MVGTTFANIAVDLIAEGLSGRMTAIRGGRYTHIAVPDPARGPRTVDVERYYNAERFRPRPQLEAGLRDDPPRERVTVGVQARGGQADHHVSGRAGFAGHDPVERAAQPLQAQTDGEDVESQSRHDDPHDHQRPYSCRPHYVCSSP